tara:strand:+ start:863 stop:1963 length:1101 start_codon:yes stop_codon:yes gene_type:complete
MANTFKTFLNSDIANARTLLHEAIPITGTIVSGTYSTPTAVGGNIKTFAHGMFEAVYDYPYLSSSANHIFDVTAGYAAQSELSSSENVQNAKKINIYNQHAQVLVGYDATGSIHMFDEDGNITGGGTKMDSCIFINFARLLVKDEIKKGSFRMNLITSASVSRIGDGGAAPPKTLGDYGAATTYKVNSPAGEYGLLYTSSTRTEGIGDKIMGHVYYQTGIAVLSSSFFSGSFDDPLEPGSGDGYARGGGEGPQITASLESQSISELANAFRETVVNIEFNNTTELNSTIYFCRANTQNYNYSSNPTYLTASKIRVKNNNPKAEPVSYITTVGLYSADNELLAVAKLSEPLKKSPSNELTLRVRLDY